MSGEPILRTERLTCDFGALRAVNGVSLSVTPGTLHSVIGPNGSGKTTLFNLISGEIRPTDGRVYFEGRDVTGLPSHAPAASRPGPLLPAHQRVSRS